MKKVSLPVLISLAFIVSCQSNNNNEPPPGNNTVTIDTMETERVDSVISPETITFFNESGLTKYAQTKAPEFDWSQFALTQVWNDDSLLVQPFRPEKDFFDNYGKLLVYSPDSSKFVDLDSYNIQVEKDKNGRWTGIEQGPDFQVSLVNRADSTSKRLFFFGPGSSIEDAVWLNNHIVYLIGVYQQSETEDKVPAVWKYDTNDNMFYLYESSNKSLADEILNYSRDVRWKGIEVK